MVDDRRGDPQHGDHFGGFMPALLNLPEALLEVTACKCMAP